MVTNSQRVRVQVTRLEEILVAALGSTMHQYCELCQRSILPSESFVGHVSTDQGHMALVQARFEHEGPSWRGWMQCWGCVAEFNHLTLNVSTGELRARGGGSEVDAAQPQPLLPQPPLQQPTAGLIDYPHVPPPPGPPPGWAERKAIPPTHVRHEQLCAEMQQVTIASGDHEEQADLGRTSWIRTLDVFGGGGGR
jgi:hypothetical protein